MVIAFAVEQELSGRGLGTLANSMGPFEETVIVDGGNGAETAAARWPTLGRVTEKRLGVRYPGSPVETVALSDAEQLAAELTTWIRGNR